MKAANASTSPSLEVCTAREIMPYIEESDYVLDLHATKNGSSKIFAVCTKGKEENATFLEKEFTVVNWETHAKGSLLEYANNKGKKAVVYEVGNTTDPQSKERAKRAIKSMLQHASLIEGREEELEEREEERKERELKEEGLLEGEGEMKEGRVLKEEGAIERRGEAELEERRVETKEGREGTDIVYEIVGLYKNKNGPFKKTRMFEDFEMMAERTLVGYDGEEKIYAEQGEVLVFVEDKEETGNVCYFKAKKMS